MLRGPSQDSLDIREDFSDLEAGGLAECHQIRSPESAASQGPRGFPGDKQGSLPTRSPSPSCSIPTLAVAMETPRGDPLLGPAELQRQGPQWALWDSHKGGRKDSHRSSLREPGMTSHGKPNSLLWELEL